MSRGSVPPTPGGHTGGVTEPVDAESGVTEPAAELGAAEHGMTEPGVTEPDAEPGAAGPTTTSRPRSRQGVAAVVLAAGAGTRFDGDGHKLLAPVGGVPLVRLAVDAARAADFAETVVVMGAVDLLAALPPDVTVLRNEDWAEGQATSLQVAVAYAGSVGHRAVVFGLGDQPGVPASAWAAVGSEDHDLVAASFDGRLRPPVKVGAALWSHLPLTGDEGGRTLIRRHPDLVRALPCEGNPDDIDTVEDLAAWN